MHIKDSDFIRGNVPMTKDEVRAISISKLELAEDSILIDIGAGTGSIGIEGATYLKDGFVYGIEKNIEAVELIKKNLEKFNIKNYKLIYGLAPKDLDFLEENSFDRIFIGGSTNNMENILDFFIEKSKKNSRFVINLITLENLGKVIDLLKEKKLLDIEIINVNISRNKKIGNYNMMIGENPIYIISGRKE